MELLSAVGAEADADGKEDQVGAGREMTEPMDDERTLPPPGRTPEEQAVRCLRVGEPAVQLG